MKRVRLAPLALLLAVSVGALLAGPARADDAALAEAQRRFQEGLPLMDAGKFEDARLKFLQAVAVLKAPPIYYNLASTEQQTGHPVEAVKHFRAFLKTGANDARVTDAMRERARQNIASLMQKLGQLSIDAPVSATVSIDGVPTDSPLDETVPVTPGKHTVEAAFGGRVRVATAQANPGVVTPVAFPNDDVAPPAPAPTPPLQRTTVGYGVPIGLAALGAVAAGVGLAFLVDSNVKANRAADFNRGYAGGACSGANQTACESYVVKSDAASSSRTVALVSLIGGGALVAGAAVAWLLWPPAPANTERKVGARRAASRARLLPLLGPVVGVQGDF